MHHYCSPAKVSFFAYAGWALPRIHGLQAQSVNLHTSIKMDFLLKIHKWNGDAVAAHMWTIFAAQDQKLTCLSSQTTPPR